MRTLLRRGRLSLRRLPHPAHDLVANMRMLLRLSTSISETRAFPARAAAAAQDAALFARFKQDPEFRVVIENLICEQGRHYLDTALRQTPGLAEQLTCSVRTTGLVPRASAITETWVVSRPPLFAMSRFCRICLTSSDRSRAHASRRSAEGMAASVTSSRPLLGRSHIPSWISSPFSCSSAGTSESSV